MVGENARLRAQVQELIKVPAMMAVTSHCLSRDTAAMMTTTSVTQHEDVATPGGDLGLQHEDVATLPAQQHQSDDSMECVTQQSRGEDDVTSLLQSRDGLVLSQRPSDTVTSSDTRDLLQSRDGLVLSQRPSETVTSSDTRDLVTSLTHHRGDVMDESSSVAFSSDASCGSVDASYALLSRRQPPADVTSGDAMASCSGGQSGNAAFKRVVVEKSNSPSTYSSRSKITTQKKSFITNDKMEGVSSKTDGSNTFIANPMSESENANFFTWSSDTNLPVDSQITNLFFASSSDYAKIDPSDVAATLDTNAPPDVRLGSSLAGASVPPETSDGEVLFDKDGAMIWVINDVVISD